MYWEAVLTEPLGKPKWSARNQRAKTTKLTERSHFGRAPDNSGAADSTREPGRALDPDLEHFLIYCEVKTASLTLAAPKPLCYGAPRVSKGPWGLYTVFENAIRSRREAVYEELHRAILRVCDRYPGLTKEIAAAILPFEQDLIWLTK